MKGGMEVRTVMDKIKINNVRSLKDTGFISLSPITVLVGENSSGKSTFLRMFPLLKQSIMKKTNGPILWAGDVDDYVDFGSFEETITNDNSSSISLTFSFSCEIDDESRVFFNLKAAKIEPADINYSITIEKNSEKEYISCVEIKMYSFTFNINYLNNGKIEFIINDKKRYYDNNSRFNEAFTYHMSRYGSRSVFGYTLPDNHEEIGSWFNKIYGNSVEPRGFERMMFESVICTLGYISNDEKQLSEYLNIDELSDLNVDDLNKSAQSAYLYLTSKVRLYLSTLSQNDFDEFIFFSRMVFSIIPFP